MRTSLVLLSLVLLSACGFDGDSGDKDGMVDTADTTPSACHDYAGFDDSTPASFRTDVLPVFQRSCGVSGSCHGSMEPVAENQPYLGPDASTTADTTMIAAIFAQTVGVASVDEPSLSRIEPGDPENSFLMHKLDQDLGCESLACAATLTCGDPMPLSSPQLSDAEREVIRRWIAQGALDN